VSVGGRGFCDFDKDELMMYVALGKSIPRDMRTEVRTPLNARGFTLVEVLATLVLLGIVLPALMKGATIALSAAELARHMTEASDLARSKLNDLVAENLWDQASNGDFSPDYPQYKFQVTNNPLNDNGLYNVQVTVTWSEAGKERKLTQTTLVYDTSTDNGTNSSGGG
jgi:prepilin-type N-terminal cleavage/methylation domain-containing protein